MSSIRQRDDRGSATGVSLAKAKKVVDEAAEALFGDDLTVQSVGVGRHGPRGYGLRVVRNVAQIRSLTARAGPKVTPARRSIRDVPITYAEAYHDLHTLLRLPSAGAGSPAATSLIPERRRHRPVVCGLQIQNFDDDVRAGIIAKGLMNVGTLGVFVKLDDGSIAILSNNHVVGGENAGKRGKDRILQPGGGSVAAGDQVATLTDFVTLQISPAGASPAAGTAVFNEVDAGVAALESGVAHTQGFLPSRNLKGPQGTAVAKVGNSVFKVGRKTGLTYGTITDIATTVGPIPYAPGPCWFHRSMTIEGVNGTMFSDVGDSGSAIIKTSTGQVVGLLYAGNGTQTYACPIDRVLALMNCTLA